MSDETPRKGVTEADLEAAARLRAIWQNMPDRPTQQALADAWPFTDSEANQSLISQYLNGRIPLNHRVVLFFAQQLGIPPSSIRTDLPEQQLRVQEARSSTEYGDWADITAFGQQVAAGDGMSPDEYADTHSLKFKRSSLRRKGLVDRRLSVFYASGESMEPRIYDGDALLFDMSETSPQDGAIFVVNYAGGLYVKRLHQYGEQWFLVSDNTSDPRWKKPVPIDSSEHFEVLGRVRWIGSWEG